MDEFEASLLLGLLENIRLHSKYCSISALYIVKEKG